MNSHFDFATGSTVRNLNSTCNGLSFIGSKMYAFLRSLVAPAKPGDKSFAELTRCLTDHLDPKPLVIAECFHFNQRIQSGRESVSEYVAEIKQLAAECDFGQRLEEAL